MRITSNPIERAIQKLWRKVFGGDVPFDELCVMEPNTDKLPFPNNSPQCISTLRSLKHYGDYDGVIPDSEDVIPVKIKAHTDEAKTAIAFRSEAMGFSYGLMERRCRYCKPNPYIRDIRELRAEIPGHGKDEDE